MRKTSFIRYIVLTAIAVTAVSCSLHESGLDQPGSLSLDFKCSDLLTRADDDPETAIESIDYFLYTSETGAAVYHNRISTTSTTAVLDNVADLKEVGKSCYVYAVANLPSDVTISGTETVAQLQSISVTTDFTTAQTSFVMDSKEAVSATVGSSVTVPLHRLAAKMTMTVNIPSSIVVGAGEGSAGTTYEPDYQHLRIYYVNAVKKGTFDGSYMTYGNSESEEGNKGNYFIYPYDWAISVTGGDGEDHVGTSVTPFYTYPQSWEPEEVHEPYFKVILPWAASGDASNSKPYYYKVVIPNDFNGKIDRNTFYKFVMDIGVLGSEVDDGSVEISGDYYVVDWSKAFTVGGDDGGDALTKGKYLSVSQSEFSIYAENSITIPVTSSHNLSVRSVTCTYTDFSTDPATDKSLPATSYDVISNGRNSITLTHELVSDITKSDLDCSVYKFDITIANEAGCDPVKVKVTQYPSIYITSELSNKHVFINSHYNHNESLDWTIINGSKSYTLLLDDGGSEHQVLTSDVITMLKDTYSYNTINGATVQLAGFKNFSTNTNAKELSGNSGTITITPPDGQTITRVFVRYWNSNRRPSEVTYSLGASSDKTYSSSNTTWTGLSYSGLSITLDKTHSTSPPAFSEIEVSYTYEGTTDRLGTLRYYDYLNSNGTNNNFNIYTINISNISGNSYGWYIADPRVSEGETYQSLKAGSSSGEQLTNYYPTNPDTPKAIAPQLKVGSSSGAALSSSFNSSLSEFSFEQAKLRCASYQENGYPAGRWRLPTEAEIRFSIELSNNGKIPSLFKGLYWAASGVTLNDQGEVEEASGASVRCVYDSWYWGDAPMSQYMTTWSGWQTD